MMITFTLIQIFSRNRKEVDTDPFHFLDLIRVTLNAFVCMALHFKTTE